MTLRPLNEPERRYVVLPGDARTFSNLPQRLRAPAAEVLLGADDRADLRACLDPAGGAFPEGVHVDAVGASLRATPAEGPLDPQPEGVTVGIRVNARFLCLALDALPPGPVLVVWRGRHQPLTLHALEGPPDLRDAFVMGLVGCPSAPHLECFGVYRPRCPCRDCCAGRRWGWS